MAKKKEPESLRKLAEFKLLLEKKITDGETELESLRILLDHVNQTLLEEGFKRADLASRKPPKVRPYEREHETLIPLKTANGDLLANLYIGQGSMRVLMAENREFSVKTPPFQQFLVERVLEKMRQKDREATAKGDLPHHSNFSYDLAVEGDVIREITINNIAADRQRELKSSIHWTLEKMYEKRRGTSDD
jgi:hypothetical protein